MSSDSSYPTITKEEFKEVIDKLNDRLYECDDKMTELMEEIADIFDVLSETIKPIIRYHYDSSPTTNTEE